MRRVLLFVVLVIGLVAPACSSGPQRRTVLVDNQATGLNAAFLAYFPNNVTVHPGDTVDFKEMWTGEPHSVTMGTLVDAGLAAQDAVKGDAEAPAFAKLPTMIPEGPGDANPNAVNPCFLDTGDPATYKTKPCPTFTQPEFTGKQAYYSSGFLPKDKTFGVKLAEDIAPGTYRFYCNLHGASMQGAIKVAAKGDDIPSVDDVTKAAQTQLDKAVATVKPNADRIKSSYKAGGIVTAGISSDDGTNMVNEFLPASVDAKVGQKVTWGIIGFHSVAFNAPVASQTDVVQGKDGLYHLNQQTFAPAGGPPAIGGKAAAPIPMGPFKVAVVDGGPYGGTGFKSSGAGPSFPPTLAGYSVTFTKAGTYPYLCTVHPGMGGVVKVT